MDSSIEQKENMRIFLRAYMGEIRKSDAPKDLINWNLLKNSEIMEQFLEGLVSISYGIEMAVNLSEEDFEHWLSANIQPISMKELREFLTETIKELVISFGLSEFLILNKEQEVLLKKFRRLEKHLQP